jgi:hypothetical protein
MKIYEVSTIYEKWGSPQFSKQLRSSSIFKQIEVVFHFQTNWCRLPFSNKLGVIFHFKQIEVIFHLKKIEVVFLISSIWVKMRLHSKNQLSKLTRTALIVMGPSVVWWWCGFLTDNNTTPTKVVLNCFGLLD